MRIFVGRRRSGFLSFSFFLLSSSSLFFDHSLSQGQDTARVQYPDDDQAGGCDDQVEEGISMPMSVRSAFVDVEIINWFDSDKLFAVGGDV